MPYSPYFKNTALDTMFATTYVSLHTGSPGTTGANEVAGGSPAYARKSISFSAASGGSKSSSSQPVLDVPAGTTVTHLGLWDAVSSGNFLGYADVTDESFAGQGTYTVTSATVDLNA